MSPYLLGKFIPQLVQTFGQDNVTKKPNANHGDAKIDIDPTTFGVPAGETIMITADRNGRKRLFSTVPRV